MALTYVQLKQAIQDWTENDSTEFTAATGSGVAPIDVCIVNAELRITKELDLTAFRKTTTIASGTATTGTIIYYALQRPGTAYTTSNRYTNILFAPTPGVDTTCEIGYTYRVPGLSASTANTYLGDRCQETLLYACLIEAATFMKDSAQLQNYQQLYERSAQTLGVEEQVRMRNTELYKGELRTLGRLEGDR